MTNRKEWKLGASSCILNYYEKHTPKGFDHLRKAGILFTELSLHHAPLMEYDFYDNPEIMLKSANGKVEFTSFHVPFSPKLHPANIDPKEDKEAMDIIEKSIRAALKIGIKIIVIHPSSEPNDDKTREQRIKTSIKNLTHLCTLCKDNGAILAVENLPRTCLCNTSAELIRIVNSVPDLQICFDTNHLLGQTNEQFLNDLIANNMHGRIKAIHVSDYNFIDEQHWLPFEGLNDWKMILSKLEELDFDGIFMYEVSKGKGKDIPYSPEGIAENFFSLPGII